MWTVTELVFWNEQAMYIRGWKVSRAQPSASSALASSSSAAFSSGSKPSPSSSAVGHGGVLGGGGLVEDALAAVAVHRGAGDSLRSRRFHQTAHSPSPRSTL